MRFLLPPIRKPFFLTGAACLVASMTLAEPARDEMTEEDRSGRQTMTAPTTDFTAQEPLEAMSGARISAVGVGPSRDATVVRHDLI